ncbi:MAG: glycosyltransferase family 39 protein [Candidatus Hydrogenedentes bacterium]|nr:glycosyltransferase family 39 protein [Candidatus Hydrogenedentota bacterium]
MGRKRKDRGPKRALPDSAPTTAWPRVGAWIFLSLIALFVIVVRIRLAPMPLERDEGEYAYAGQLILQGVPPFSQVYNMKMPGIYFAYALILAVFGQTQAGIHLALLFLNLATAVFIFLLAQRVVNTFVASIAAAVWGVMSTSAVVMGLSAHAEHFVVCFAFAGLWVMLRAWDKPQRVALLLAGVLLGIAFTMKQQGAVFIALAAITTVARYGHALRAQHRAALLDCAALIGGAVLPFMVICGLLAASGVFDRFWFWTFDYAGKYGAVVSFRVGAKNLYEQLLKSFAVFWPLWLLVILGIVHVIRDASYVNKRTFLFVLAILSFLGVCPGLYFREHYFILLLPAVAYFAGAGTDGLRQYLIQRRRSGEVVALVITATGVLLSIWTQREFLFRASPVEACRRLYQVNPFVEAPEIAAHIRERSDRMDTVAVLGSEPEIYFYAQRRSASGYIYMYPLMEYQPYADTMQKEMIAEIEAAEPKFLVIVNVWPSWLQKSKSKLLVFDWINQYSNAHYRQVGLIEIGEDGTTRYRWDKEAQGVSSRVPFNVVVLERRDTPARTDTDEHGRIRTSPQ